MDRAALILSIVLVIGAALTYLYWDDLPKTNLAGAVTLDVPELHIDQQQLNLCMNSCMRACVTDFGMEQQCLDKCNSQCGA